MRPYATQQLIVLTGPSRVRLPRKQKKALKRSYLDLLTNIVMEKLERAGRLYTPTHKRVRNGLRVKLHVSPLGTPPIRWN